MRSTKLYKICICLVIPSADANLLAPYFFEIRAFPNSYFTETSCWVPGLPNEKT